MGRPEAAVDAGLTGPARPADTRQRILRAALRVIGEGGVAALTNRRVAGEAGVSLGSITYHFQSQNELLRESLSLFVREEAERLTAMAEARTTGELTVEQAAALVEQVVESTTFGREEIAPLELFIQAGRDPSLRAAAERCFAGYDAIASMVLAGLGVPDPEHRLARAVVALIGGLQLRRLASGAAVNTGLADALTMLVRGARES